MNWKLTGQSVSNYGRRICAFRNLIIERGSVEKTPHGRQLYACNVREAGAADFDMFGVVSFGLFSPFYHLGTARLNE